MRAKPDWGTGPPTAFIEDRRLLRYRRVVVPANRVEWYKSVFGGENLFRPRRSCPNARLLSDRGRRTVVCFDDPLPTPARAVSPLVAVVVVGTGAKGPSTLAHLGAVEPEGIELPAPPPRLGLVLKEERYPFPTLLHGILTVPRAEREFHNLLALRSLGFPAVEPLACGHSGFWILYHRSFLVTREFEGAVSLKSWMKSHLKGKAVDFTPEEVRGALIHWARDLARLHRARVYVRTLYGKNILARRADDGRIELALCDVPRLWWFRGRSLSFGLAARDLATLDKWARQAFGPRPRLAFLVAYLEELGEGPPLRRWVGRILRQRERMRHRTFLGRSSRRFKRFLKRWRLGDYWPF
ncbi:MAG TPA: lipopolysaccharide kinase InaA family protein [Planctomycetota bacterium]|nr:lipopolysaccharide kinase InaA family protein [Planctomycetota bacterium]